MRLTPMDPDLYAVTDCARCGDIIVRCTCQHCPFHGWRHAGSGRHLCVHDRAALVKALAPLSAVA